jgi:hypothetical protein
MVELSGYGKSERSGRGPGSPVLAWLNRHEFGRARRVLGVSLWSNYDEFIQERDGLFVGYGAAGVSASFQPVPFAAFERWTRLTGARPELGELDEFAAHWRWRESHPYARVRGRFCAFVAPERDPASAASAQCVRIHPDLYARWRDDYAKATTFEAPGLDAYAALVVECCIGPDPFKAWPEVNSAWGFSAKFDERE